jgi:hypothetical protein
LPPEGFFNELTDHPLQQGDVFVSVPLIDPPRGPQLVVVCPDQPSLCLDQIAPDGTLRAMQHTAIRDLQDRVEFIVSPVTIGPPAMLLTQSCDLDDPDLDFWLVTPVLSLEGTAINSGNLFAGAYAHLFGIPAHPSGEFPDAYVDLKDIRQIHKAHVKLANRVVSLSHGAASDLSAKLATTFARRWGYAAGDAAPRTGHYRCETCNRYGGITPTEIDVAKEAFFPRCPQCARIHKTEAYYLLRPHKK